MPQLRDRQLQHSALSVYSRDFPNSPRPAHCLLATLHTPLTRKTLAHSSRFTVERLVYIVASTWTQG